MHIGTQVQLDCQYLPLLSITQYWQQSGIEWPASVRKRCQVYLSTIKPDTFSYIVTRATGF